MPAIYPLRRKSPFAPYDENDPQATVEDQGSMYGPNTGLVATPAPPPQQGPPSMFTPAPTGPMPDFSRQQDMNTMPEIPPASMSAPSEPRGRRTNIAGDPIPQRPTPPPSEPQPKLNWYTPTGAYDREFRAWQARQQDADRRYAVELSDYQREVQNQEQANYWRNANPPQAAEVADIRGRYQVEAAKIRNMDRGTAARHLISLVEDPNTDEATLAWAQDMLRSMPQFGNFRPQAPQRPFPPDLRFSPTGEGVIWDPNTQTVRPLPGSAPAQPPPSGAPPSVAAPNQAVPSAVPQPSAATGGLPPGPYTKAGGGLTPQDFEAAAQAIAPMDINSLNRSSDIASYRNDVKTRLFARAKQINPNFNWAEIGRKTQILKDFTSGTSGVNLQSLDTFMGHAGDLADVIRSTPQTQVPLLNQSYNWWRTHMSGDPQFARLQTAILPVGREFMNFILNNKALYDIDRDEAKKVVNGDMPLNTMLAALEQMGETVDVRYGAMNSRFKSTMKQGFQEAFPESFSPRGVAGARKLGVDLGAGGGVGGSGGGGNAAPVGTIINVNGQRQIKTEAGWKPYSGR